ncbi:MAG: hypothetical protein K8I65_14020 [Thermoanaerobaculia bacterium]|nr:hypothetical protein [Thermoanaerobaculia bacterium]
MIEVTIRPDAHLAKFYRELSVHVGDMRNTLRAIEDGSYAARVAERAAADDFIRFSIAHRPERDTVAFDESCRRAFLGMNRSLVELLDWIVAIKRMVGVELQIPVTGDRVGKDALLEFTRAKLKEKYLEVARQVKLSSGGKLDEINLCDQYARMCAESYFRLRRYLEHRGGHADEDFEVHIVRLSIFLGDREIRPSELPIEASGETLGMRRQRTSISFPRGQAIRLSEDDVERIYWTLRHYVGPMIGRTAGSFGDPPPAP